MPAITPAAFVAGLQGLATFPFADLAAAASARFLDPGKDAIVIEDALALVAAVDPALAVPIEILDAALFLLPLLVANGAPATPNATMRGRDQPEPTSGADWSHGPPAFPAPWDDPAPEPDNPAGAIGG